MEGERITIPGWRIIRTIGKGSFGTVYEIEKEGEFGSVAHSALKIISIPETDAEIKAYLDDGYDNVSLTTLFRSRVEDITAEFEMMSKLKGCSNIVSYEDHKIVQHENDPGYNIYIRMELLTSLPAHFGRVSSDERTLEQNAIKLGSDICTALELCAKHRIIHRDIKPQNIFVNDNGDYKLGDFGIAKTSDHTTRATKTGTYGYMAPEVYLGRPYNAQVDLYSLGLVMYWMLNERRGPFLPLPPEVPKPSQNAEAMERRMRGEELPAPKNGGDALKRIVLKACAFDPADRYADPTEMKRDLRCLSIDEEEGVAEDESTAHETSVLNTARLDETVASNRKDPEKDRGRHDSDATVGIWPGSSNEKPRYCVQCGARLTQEDRFCTACGAKQIPSSSPKKPETTPAGPSSHGKPSPVYRSNPQPDEPVEKAKARNSASKKTGLIVALSAVCAVLLIVLIVAVIESGKGQPTATQNAGGTTVRLTSTPIAKEPAVAATAPTSTPTPTPTPAGRFANVSIGDIITFGRYEQDGNRSKKEDIEWIVLDRDYDGKSLLLISRYALDCKVYHTNLQSITWEKCSLNEWLNGEFKRSAFSADEEKLIKKTPVYAEKNTLYPKTGEGADTENYIFIFGIKEVSHYFDTDEKRQCSATKYAIEQGAYDEPVLHTTWWWLRTPGSLMTRIACVRPQGSIRWDGHDVNYNTLIAVRPAMWVKIEE